MRHLWNDPGKRFLVACVPNGVYPFLVLFRVYPVQTMIEATVPAILPDLVFRDFANRLG